MHEKPRREKGRWSVPAVLLLSGALYVLSIGPTAKLVNANHKGASLWRATYAPMIWAAYNSYVTDKAICKYLTLWQVSFLNNDRRGGRLDVNEW